MQNAIDVLTVQVEEIQALQAMYPEDGAVCFTSAEQAALEMATALVETAPDTSAPQAAQQEAQLCSLPQLSGALSLQGARIGGQPVRLRFTFPAPDTAAKAAASKAAPDDAAVPRMQVECSCDRSHHDKLTAAVQQCASDSTAGCMLLAAGALRQRVHDLIEQGQLQSDMLSSGAAADAFVQPQPPAHATLCRCVIWFHHIKNLNKRKHIVQWAHELRLGGYSKPGFPGVIVCEGLDADVQEYIQRLRTLKWQAMAVRGEETERFETPESPAAPGAAADAGRRFGADPAFHELPETGMSELAAACRTAGIEQLFLTALKIVK